MSGGNKTRKGSAAAPHGHHPSAPPAAEPGLLFSLDDFASDDGRRRIRCGVASKLMLGGTRDQVAGWRGVLAAVRDEEAKVVEGLRAELGEKDQEIVELKRLLEQQQGAGASTTVRPKLPRLEDVEGGAPN